MKFTGHAPKHLFRARGKFVSEFVCEKQVGERVRARCGAWWPRWGEFVGIFACERRRRVLGENLLEPPSLPLARKPFVFNALMPRPLPSESVMTFVLNDF